MAYVLECFSVGNCLYRGEHTGSDHEVVASAVSAAQWAQWAIQRGIAWITQYWPDQLALDIGISLPSIPVGPICLWCTLDKVYDAIFGKDGLLDGWGYETVGACLPTVGFIAPARPADVTVCAVRDLQSNTGVSISVSGPVGLSLKESDFYKGGGFAGYLSLGLLVSSANTIYELAGWSVGGKGVAQ